MTLVAGVAAFLAVEAHYARYGGGWVHPPRKAITGEERSDAHPRQPSLLLTQE